VGMRDQDSIEAGGSWDRSAIPPGGILPALEHATVYQHPRGGGLD